MTHLSLSSPGLNHEALLGVLEPVLVAHAVAGVEVTLHRERGGWVLRVSIEDPTSTEPGGGITLDRCADVSRDFSHALDVADLISHAYTLEVASPGLERPLFTAEEYSRFRGKLAKVTLGRAASDGQFVLRGIVEGAEAGVVSMVVDGKKMAFPLADVRSGHLVFELGAKGAPRGRPSPKKAAERSAKRPRAAGTE